MRPTAYSAVKYEIRTGQAGMLYFAERPELGGRKVALKTELDGFPVHELGGAILVGRNEFKRGSAVSTQQKMTAHNDIY